MRRKTWFILRIVVIAVWFMMWLYFDTLHFRYDSLFSSAILLIGLISMIIYLAISVWWNKVKQRGLKAVHERGNFTISYPTPFLKIPAEHDENGNTIYEEYNVYARNSLNVPSQYISVPGGREDGFVVVPAQNIRIIGGNLDLGTADIDAYITPEQKMNIPGHIIPQIAEKSIKMGFGWSDDWPIFMGEVPSIVEDYSNLEKYIKKEEFDDLPEAVKTLLNNAQNQLNIHNIQKSRLAHLEADNKTAWGVVKNLRTQIENLKTLANAGLISELERKINELQGDKDE